MNISKKEDFKSTNNILKMKGDILDNWEDILLVKTHLKEENIKTKYSLQFVHESIPVDLLVTINFGEEQNKGCPFHPLQRGMYTKEFYVRGHHWEGRQQCSIHLEVV